MVDSTSLQRARALIGWMAPGDVSTYCGASGGPGAGTALAERAGAARQAVADRPAATDQRGTIAPLPAVLHDYVREFSTNQYAKPFMNAGWQVRMADLSKLYAFQETVCIEPAQAQTAHANKDDLLSLARVTLGLETYGEPTVHFDSVQRAWVISSLNRNLDVIGHFTRSVPGGVGCGFMAGVTPSFMQVIRYRGRYLLKDGYHRAFGLLRSGISQVPVLFLEMPSDETLDLGNSHLPPEAWLGPRPPRLPDYQDDSVSTEVMLPGTRKMIVISTMDINAAV